MGKKFNKFFKDAFDPPKPKIPKDLSAQADLAAETAAAKERDDLRRGQTQTKRSGTVAEALSAAVGRTNLGGTA